MCAPDAPPQDNSAAIARQQAAERESKIRTGQGEIDKAFSIFDPAYYDTFSKTYTDYYNPQVDKQFGDARQGLKYNLARKGMQDSTPGQNAFGDLIDSYGQKREQVAANAKDATNALRTDVETNKGDLYSQNTASADPSLSAASAVSRAGSLQSTPSFSPLGDLFGGLVNTGTAYYQGTQRGLPAGYRDLFPGSSSGSVRVTN
jgi:curved DNA-binding protein CbpA